MLSSVDLATVQTFVPTGVCATSSRALHEGCSDLSEKEEPSASRSFVKSVARGMTVIHAFTNATRPLSIADVSHRTNVPRAAVRRMLHTLCELGYVRSLDLRFELTAKTLQLGHAFSSSSPIAGSVRPVVGRLAEELGTFCAMTLPDNDQTMLMCLAGTSKPAYARNTCSGIGSRLPHYASASGHLFLGELSRSQLGAYFERIDLRPLTHYTPTLPQRIQESVAHVRERGYALCDRTFASDVSSIAVPVRNARGQVLAAIVAVVQAHRLAELDLRSTWLPALRRAAEQASQCWHRADNRSQEIARLDALAC